MGSLLKLLAEIVGIYELVILGAVIISWVAPLSRHPAVTTVRSITEPVFGAIRRTVHPVIGNVDLSPMLALVLCHVVRTLLIRAAGAGA